MPSSNKFKHALFGIFIISIGIISASLLYKGGGELVSLVKNAVAAKSAVATVPAAVILPPPPPAAPAEITLNFVGDIMLDRAVLKSVEKNFKGDWNSLFENVGELSRADILFGNLEGPVSVGGKKSGSVYSFRMSPASLEAVAEAGFDVLSIANNHIGDWGSVAFADTLDAISSEGMKYAGGGWSKSEAKAPTIIEKNGIKIGFLGFSDVGPKWMEAKNNTPGILSASDPDFDQIVQNASRKVDILVVSFHFGEEYKKHTKRQETLAHRAIDDGAKLIIGSHPHIIQETEEYGGGLISYSLGNFIFDQKFSKETMEGLLLEATVTKDGLKDYSTKIIKLDSSFVPQSPIEQ